MGFSMRLGFKKALLFSAVAFLFIGNHQTVFAQNAPTEAAQSTKPSAADFVKRAGKNFSISPNGKTLVFMTGEVVNAKVVLIDIESGQTRDISLGDKTKPRSVSWAGDNYLLISVSFFYDADDTQKNSNYRYEIYRTVSYSLANGKTALLMPSEELHMNVSLGVAYVNQDNPREIIMTAMRGRDGFYASDQQKLELNLFKTSLNTGRGPSIARGAESTADFVLDKNGSPAIRIDIEAAKRKVTTYRLDGRSWNKFQEYTDTLELPYTIEGFLDSDTLLIIESNEEGVNRPKKLNIRTGASLPMFETETRSIDSVIMDPYNHEPIGLVYDNFTPQVKWLSPQMQQYQDMLGRAFPNKYVYIKDWDKDKKNLIIGVEAGDSLYSHFLFNPEKRSAELLSLHPEAFETFKFASKTIEKMAASDGAEISVLVTRPNNSQNKKLPAIILPHGGPQASDTPGFDYESQFLASRGYVVIQPQFRGSSGFGYDFERAGYGEWSGKMQSDVDETVKWASDKGWIDKDRVCIVGSSYGGYSALVGVSQTPDLYKCAVSYGGVFDLAEMQERAEERGGSRSYSLAYWKEHMGLNRFDKAKIRAISPMYQVQNIKVPVLLMHGIEDTVVPIKQSRDMATAMRRAGKNVQFIEFEKEDHWLSRAETRERHLVEIEKFLAPILRPEQ